MPEPITEPIVEPTDPKEKTYSEKEWKGLLSDKQNETRSRQQANADAANYKQQIADLKAQIEAKSSTVEEITGDDEDVITKAELKKILAKQEKKLLDMYTKEKKTETKEARDKRIEKSFQKAIDSYTEEKAGKGLTFNEVNEGTKRMIAKNKIYKDLIFSDDNPGEKAYEVGLMDETIAKRHATYKKTLPPKTVANKEGMESTTSPKGFYSEAYVKKMATGNQGWVKANFAAIQESMKSWGKKK